MPTNFDRRLNNIDFLRLAFALLVVFSHSFPITQGSNTAEPFMRLTREQATGGSIAVDAFFILSGFLITASYSRSASAFSFLKKRIARIYPAFLVMIRPWVDQGSSSAAPSRGTYLYAFPIQQLLTQHFALRSPVHLFAAATPAVLAVAATSWFSIERPALRWAKQRHQPQRAAAASIGSMIPVSAE
jgi:peptidoglycan/LPS O-acetylase OafA/YrhL